jgi:N-acylneuraminate cytidylyltransferase
LFEWIFVTSDDHDIRLIAQNAGAKSIVRPEQYSHDDVGTQEVAKRTIEQIEQEGIFRTNRFDQNAPAEFVCVIYPTSPLMYVGDLLAGRAIMRDYDCDFAMSVGAYPLRDAAQLYWGKRSAFLEEVPLISEFTVMVPVAESRICDINTEEDWERAEIMYKALYPERPA